MVLGKKNLHHRRGDGDEVRATGIEPVSHAWEARVLPLNDARLLRREVYDMLVGMSSAKKIFLLMVKFVLANRDDYGMLAPAKAGIA